ncbi:hypothetical protein sync_1255 [Synechococcus sp. CC9311]|nr:hypothetical protein sync_1255 [Synechococcus sp. CC9311]
MLDIGLLSSGGLGDGDHSSELSPHSRGFLIVMHQRGAIDLLVYSSDKIKTGEEPKLNHG